MPSDRGLSVMQVWQGFGSIVLNVAMLIIALIALGVSSTSGPSIAPASLAGAMQVLAATTANASAAILNLDGQIG